MACQNLGPLEKGGVVVGIDTKVILHLLVHFS